MKIKRLTSTPMNRIKRENIKIVVSQLNGNRCTNSTSGSNENASLSVKHQVSFFNDLSSIENKSFRQRSKSYGTKPVQQNSLDLDAYKKFPNWRWDFLKYFGVNQEDFMKRFDDSVPGESFNDLFTVSKSVGRGCNGFPSDSMRRRSKTFSKPTAGPNFNSNQWKRFGANSEDQWLKESTKKESFVIELTTKLNSVNDGKLSYSNKTFAKF